MPVNKNEKEATSTGKQELTTISLRKPGRKAPGTRLGMLDDWRAGSTKSGKLSGRHGHTVRDGR